MLCCDSARRDDLVALARHASICTAHDDLQFGQGHRVSVNPLDVAVQRAGQGSNSGLGRLPKGAQAFVALRRQRGAQGIPVPKQDAIALRDDVSPSAAFPAISAAAALRPRPTRPQSLPRARLQASTALLVPMIGWAALRVEADPASHHGVAPSPHRENALSAPRASIPVRRAAAARLRASPPAGAGRDATWRAARVPGARRPAASRSAGCG